MDWGGTPLWICWRVLRWISQHLIWMTKMRILEACCMCWNFEAPPDSTMSAPSIETFEWYFDVLKWPHRIWFHDVCNQCFSNSMSIPDIGIYRLLSEDQSPRPDFLLFLLVTLWCFYLWRGPKLLSEKITGAWSTAFIRFKLIVSRALIFCKFRHVCQEECQSNTLLYMKIMWMICMDLFFCTCWSSTTPQRIAFSQLQVGTALVWSPCGRRLAVGGGKHKIWLCSNGSGCGSNFVKIAVF